MCGVCVCVCIYLFKDLLLTFQISKHNLLQCTSDCHRQLALKKKNLYYCLVCINYYQKHFFNPLFRLIA